MYIYSNPIYIYTQYYGDLNLWYFGYNKIDFFTDQ